MRKLMIVLLMATAALTSSCIASRKFVRTEVKTSSDALSTRIDANDSDLKEVHDGITRADARITGVDDRLTLVSTETGQRLDGLKVDVSAVDQKVATVDQKVATVDQNARTAADRLGSSVNSLDQKFQNRNSYSVADEKAINFRFDSATLDAAQQPVLDEIAQVLMQNADALVVLEGRTDSSGNQEYNVRLGERRVEAVRRYLAVEKGVPVFKIHQISFGAAKPIAPNDSREGREKNRAVSITLRVPSAPTAAVSSR